MFNDSFKSAAAAAVLLVASSTGAAQAAVIGATPDSDFSTDPATFGFGDDAARYILSQELQTPVFGTAGGVTEAVATRGTARVSRSTINADQAAAYASGVLLGPDQAVGGDYVAFADPANVALDSRTPFLGLSFLLDDGVHYGYAEAAGSSLTRFAYESSPDTAIATGAAIEQTIGDDAPIDAPADVPAPANLAIFGLALALIGGLGVRRRQR